MVVEHLYHDDSAIRYVLVSFGSCLIIIVFLLLCGKKEKKEDAYGGETPTVNVNGYPTEKVVVDVEEPIVPVHVTDVQNASEGSSIHNGTSSMTTHTDKNQSVIIQPPTPDTTQPTTPTTLQDVEPSCPAGEEDSTNPYARVPRTTDDVLPVFEYSGNTENSGNSLYAKVQDVKREETAYAVVDCKDKDYDFVNGELVRRKVDVEVEGEAPTSPGMDLYDSPVSPPMRKLADEEIENSGASGIYEVVSECKKKNEETVHQFDNVGSSDIYDSCGPPFEGISTTPPAAPPRDSPPHDTNNTLSVESTVVRRGSSKEKLNGKSQKTDKNEKHEHDEKQKGGLFKSLKFGHSRKSKKAEENQARVSATCESTHVVAVDIAVEDESPSNAVEETAPPPLPSVDKLMHISAHRKQHSQSDINPFPETASNNPSPTESPSNPDQISGHPFSRHERRASDDRHSTSESPLLQKPPHPPHRGRSSENGIVVKETTLESQPLSKTNSSPLPESNPELKKDNNSASLKRNPLCDMDSRESILSEPDYAEITSNEPTFRVKESSFDNLLPGYTCIDYGNQGDKHNIKHTADHGEGNEVAAVNEEAESAPTYHISCHPAPYNMNDDDDDYADYDEVVRNSEMRSIVRDSSRKSDRCTTDLDSDTAVASEGVPYSKGPSWDQKHNGMVLGSEHSPEVDGFAAADTEVGVSVDSDYAAIDFSARDEERRIKNLYAAIDFSAKKPREAESCNVEEEMNGEDLSQKIMYEGTYSVISDKSRTLTAEDSLQDSSHGAIPLYEEVPTHMQR